MYTTNINGCKGCCAEIRRFFLFLNSVHLKILNLKYEDIVLLNMSAIELLALQKHYKDQGLSNSGADFTSKLAVLVGANEKEISISDICQITSYKKRQCCEHLAQAKLIGLVERKRTKQSRMYSIRIQIPQVFLPCNNDLAQLIMDKLQNAYGLDLVFSVHFIQQVITRSKLIEVTQIAEAIDDLINSNKITFYKLALYPSLQHNFYQKDHCIIVKSFEQDFSDLNHKQARFIKYLKDVCQIHANSNEKSRINKLLSTKIFYEQEMSGGSYDKRTRAYAFI